MIEKPFLLFPERIERLEQLNSDNEQVLELLGFVRAYEKEVARLQKALKEISNYQRDQYESNIYAYDNCKIIAKQALERTKP